MPSTLYEYRKKTQPVMNLNDSSTFCYFLVFSSLIFENKQKMNYFSRDVCTRCTFTVLFFLFTQQFINLYAIFRNFCAHDLSHTAPKWHGMQVCRCVLSLCIKTEFFLFYANMKMIICCILCFAEDPHIAIHHSRSDA